MERLTEIYRHSLNLLTDLCELTMACGTWRAPCTDLLVPMMRDGEAVNGMEPIDVVRNRAHDNLQALHRGIKRFLNPHEYPVGLEKKLHDLRAELILEAREGQR